MADFSRATDSAIRYLHAVRALDERYAALVDEAVGKFYADNCVEETEGRFLCPLSGKRFKAAEFVRKHIDNKHADALAAVRERALAAKYLELFLLDPHKPPQAHRTVLRGAFAQKALQRALAASGGRRQPERSSYGERGGYERGGSYERGSYERGTFERGGGYERGNGADREPTGAPYRDPRALRQYVDLDAPDVDDFARSGTLERKPIVYD